EALDDVPGPQVEPADAGDRRRVQETPGVFLGGGHGESRSQGKKVRNQYRSTAKPTGCAPWDPRGAARGLGPVGCILTLDLLQSRRENSLEPFVARQLALAAGRLLEHLVHDRVRRDALGGGGEVRQDAVPQHRVGQRLDVLTLDV